MPSKRTQPARDQRHREKLARHGFRRLVLVVPITHVERLQVEAQALRDEYFKLALPLGEPVTAND